MNPPRGAGASIGRALLLVCLCIAVRASAADGTAPVIVIDEPLHDFGTVAEGGAARHLFKVRNAGNAPLEIKSVTASCGCTAAAPKEKLIAPGRSGEIDVSFDTRGRPGKNEKVVTIVSNDPKTPTTTVRIKIDVQQMLGFNPPYSFLQGFAGEPVKGEAWLTGKLAGSARPKVTRVEPADAVKVEVAEKRTDGATQRGLRFQLTSRAVGQGTFKVVLATGIPAQPTIDHQVTWLVRGNVEVPATVFLDLARPELKERVIPVSSRRPDFRLKAARVLEGPFNAVLVTGEGRAPAAVKVTTTLPQPPATPVAGKLVIESNDPLEPKKEVSVTVAAVRTR